LEEYVIVILVVMYAFCSHVFLCLTGLYLYELCRSPRAYQLFLS
jgi:hypothetical protein